MHHGMNRGGENGHDEEPVTGEWWWWTAPQGDVVPGIEYGLKGADYENEGNSEE